MSSCIAFILTFYAFGSCFRMLAIIRVSDPFSVVKGSVPFLGTCYAGYNPDFVCVHACVCVCVCACMRVCVWMCMRTDIRKVLDSVSSLGTRSTDEVTAVRKDYGVKWMKAVFTMTPLLFKSEMLQEESPVTGSHNESVHVNISVNSSRSKQMLF